MVDEEYLHQERMEQGKCDAPNTGFGEQKLDLDTLKRLAKAATQGRWDYSGHEVFLKSIDSWPVVANCRNKSNAAYIAAANPQVILKLIAELRQAVVLIRKEREARNWLATMLGEHYGKEDGTPQKWLDEAKRIAGLHKPIEEK